MKEILDQELLGRYAESGSESAFEQLVQRHVHHIYSTALRIVVDPHLAQDVTQRVFLVLAEQAQSLSKRAVLSGWLHVTTRNLAVKMARTEARRRMREQEAAIMQQNEPSDEEAWRQVSPKLDEAIAQLNDTDRDALTLRFFERLTAKQIADRLGVSVEAAQKRTTRALERLRHLLSAHGVSLSAATLSSIMASHVVQAAPSLLIHSITTAAAIGTAVPAAAAQTSWSYLTTMASINTKSIAGTLLGLGLIGSVIWQAKENRELRYQNGILQEQIVSLRQMTSTNFSRQSGTLSSGELEELARLRKEHSEVMRLRGQIGVLQRQLTDVRDASQVTNSTSPEKLNQQSTLRFGQESDPRSLQDSGHATPEASFESILWAAQNDRNRFGQMFLLSPSLGAKRDRWTDISQYLATSFASEIAGAKSVRLQRARNVEIYPDSSELGMLTVLDLELLADDESQKRELSMAFKQVGTNWSPVLLANMRELEKKERPASTLEGTQGNQSEKLLNHEPSQGSIQP